MLIHTKIQEYVHSNQEIENITTKDGSIVVDRLLNVCFSDDVICELFRKRKIIQLLRYKCQNASEMYAYAHDFRKVDSERHGSHFRYYFRTAIDLIWRQ